jgi:hypothetical protein
MFMFRIILYIYDLKTEATPATPSERLAYFFLLPNLCFPLFPVVDYRTFLGSYYDTKAAEIYQKGVYWILRGVMHLLLYRMVYYMLPRADSDLSGIFGVYIFMAMMYALYLRVSGLFHLITGILCVFGFNLPRTNNHYFLASSFNDLWRRINIYWKDFMMSIVFYPIFMTLRRRGMTTRLSIATIGVFIVTWFLHSYQWFWLEGLFPVASTDITFWGVLGIALAANSIWEARQGRERALSRPTWTLKGAFWVTTKTWLVFSFMAVLWSLWDSGSFLDWGYRLLRIRESTEADWGLFIALLGIVLFVGIGAQWLNARGRGVWHLEGFLWKHAQLTIFATAGVLLLVAIPDVHAHLGKYATRVVLRAKANTPNRLDMERRERGYYETLTRSSKQESVDGNQIEDLGWVGLRETPVVIRTEDIRSVTLAASAEITLKGAHLRTNRWGMRDREYTKAKPEGTYRLALLGSSHVMGLGVEGEETFDNQLEVKLDEETPSAGNEAYQVLNFAVGGYGLLQMVYVAKHITPQFGPDAILYFIHPGEVNRMIDRLRAAMVDGAKLDQDFPYIDSLLEKANAGVGLPPDEFRRRLLPYSDEMLNWSLRELASAIRDQQAIPVFVFLPFTRKNFENDELRQLSDVSNDVGAIAIPLTEVYENYDPDQLGISAWDDHPNALGHRLIAEHLLRALKSTTALLAPDANAPR